MINVFVDESGNLGKGGEFFTIAAIAFNDSDKGNKRVSRLIKKSCLRFSLDDHPLKELKCNKLSFTQKQAILNKITARADHEIFYITAQKKYVALLQQNRDKNLVYNYLAGILSMEIIKKYNDDVSINFDQRTTAVASMNSLTDYIKIKAYTSGNFKHNLHVSQFDSRSMYNLQAADIIAGIINYSYMNQKKHLINLMEAHFEVKIEFPRDKFEKSLW